MPLNQPTKGIILNLEKINYMKNILIIIIIILTSSQVAHAQKYAVSTNALALVTGTVNVAVDFKINHNVSVDVPLYINPIKTKNVSLVSILSQPAAKIWLYNTYTAHYLSMGASVGYYSLANKKYTYKGYTGGLGFGYGYNWAISKQLNISAEIGIGVNYLDYEDRPKYTHYTEDEYIHHRKQIVVLPYRCGVSLNYLF